MRSLFLYTYLRFKSIFYSKIVCTVVTKKVFRQKYFVTCGCNRVHLPSPYSDGGADCHSKKTRPGANIFFYISFLCYKEFHGTIQFRFPKPPFSDPKKTLFDHCCSCLLVLPPNRRTKRYHYYFTEFLSLMLVQVHFACRLVFPLDHGVWKSQKKSHSTLRAKRATFTFWVDKS